MAFLTLSRPNFALYKKIKALHQLRQLVCVDNLPNGVGTQVSGNFRVVGTAEIAEGSNSVLLANLKSNDGAICHILNNWKVLGDDSFVDAVEFLDNCTAHVEEFHSGDLEAGLKDSFKHLASLAFTLNVGLNQAQSAVIKDSSCLHGAGSRILTSKPEIVLALIRAKGVGSMNSVLSAIGTEASPNRLGCLGFGVLCVGRSDSLTPLADGILSDKFHTNHDIARNELLKVGEEWLALVLAVKGFS